MLHDLNSFAYHLTEATGIFFQTYKLFSLSNSLVKRSTRFICDFSVSLIRIQVFLFLSRLYYVYFYMKLLFITF